MALGSKVSGFNSSKDNKTAKTSTQWLRILYWGLVASAVYFAYLNIQPYETAVRFLSGKVINQAVLYLISVIPIINGIANFLGKGVTWILGTILWAVIQIIGAIRCW
ncbi:MAG: hypothetical protein KME22_08955 [Hassallia sp. WJT32-NPBG1]|jgi:hypothetical protein|nr:hypothetical protein [Hassallia sp. WJT32-NPBG1]